MRYLEIILKLAFVVTAIFVGVNYSVHTSDILIFLAISFLLGIILLFNKKQSYGYTLEKREIVIRRIEGVLLVLFSIILFFILLKNPIAGIPLIN